MNSVKNLKPANLELWTRLRCYWPKLSTVKLNMIIQILAWSRRLALYFLSALLGEPLVAKLEECDKVKFLKTEFVQWFFYPILRCFLVAICGTMDVSTIFDLFVSDFIRFDRSVRGCSTIWCSPLQRPGTQVQPTASPCPTSLRRWTLHDPHSHLGTNSASQHWWLIPVQVSLLY